MQRCDTTTGRITDDVRTDLSIKRVSDPSGGPAINVYIHSFDSGNAGWLCFIPKKGAFGVDEHADGEVDGRQVEDGVDDTGKWYSYWPVDQRHHATSQTVPLERPDHVGDHHAHNVYLQTIRRTHTQLYSPKHDRYKI